MAKKAIQIHIPKTGGGGVRSFLTAVSGTKFSGTKGWHKKLGSAQIRRIEKDVLSGGHEPYYFAFIREPLSRFVSAFYWFKKNERRRSRHRSSGKKFWQQRRVKELAPSLADKENVTAEEWWSVALETPALLEEARKITVNFCPATRWIKDDTEEVHLYDFGDFDNELLRLASELGYKVPEGGVATKRSHPSKHGTVDEELSKPLQEKLRAAFPGEFNLYERMLNQKKTRA
jgi:hypothetical protein